MVIELKILVKKQTEKAVLVQNLTGADIWIPKSQIEFESDCLECGNHLVQMPEWLAIDKELV